MKESKYLTSLDVIELTNINGGGSDPEALEGSYSFGYMVGTTIRYLFTTPRFIGWLK
ncbi:hypothetical protein [Leeuwenhoekiella marinoflava]|uniref:hypothetical protein n=1 Tax=Leeuwenhoekiella marinoflava TaxID=988 RepID=UPI003001DAFE